MCSAWFSSKISFWSKSSTFSFVERTLLQRSCSLLSYIVANMYICTRDDCETVSTHSWTFNTSQLSKISPFKVVQSFFKGLNIFCFTETEYENSFILDATFAHHPSAWCWSTDDSASPWLSITRAVTKPSSLLTWYSEFTVVLFCFSETLI